VIVQNTPTLTPRVQPSGTPTTGLLAPPITGPTSTVGTPGRPPVLIPVTGADLTGVESEKQIFVSRVHQVQTGLNFLGFGLLLIGMVLMSGKKKEEED
jgi:hypothetical protein